MLRLTLRLNKVFFRFEEPVFSLGNGITYRKEGAGVQEIVVYEFTHNGTNA